MNMIYHGKSFDDILNIVEASRPSMSREYDSVETSKSEKLTNYSDKLQEITVTAWIRSNPKKNDKSVGQLRDELLFYLTQENDDERLIFSDRPDRFYNAKFSGEIELEYINQYDAKVEITFSCMDIYAHALDAKQFPFQDEDDETVIENRSTTSAPLDIHATFLSDADSIGFTNDTQTVQFGTTFSEDESESEFVPSDRVIRDGMGPTYRNEWKLNVGRPRFKYDYGEGSSRVTGKVRWEDSKVRITDYGSIKDDDPGFWHGPTLTRNLTESLDNFTAYFRFKMKPGGKRKNRPKSQGLLEINLMDADNNFVMGFGLKDNDPNKASVMYDFFIGDYRVFRGYLPKKVLNYTTGIFGYIEMTKIGNQFSFKLCHLKEGFRENWSVKKTYHNDSVAMLSAKTINFYGAQWKQVRDMITEWTSTTVTKINTEDDSLVPLVFYEGDELFVDGQNNHVYINGIRDDNYRVIGSSQFLTAAVGKTAYSVLTAGNVEGYYEMREQYL
ncbi:MAG: phage tail family protein [Tetragenococcus koreensis]|nr:phage tail family protein [Tetragenococcus koreensis]